MRRLRTEIIVQGCYWWAACKDAAQGSFGSARAWGTILGGAVLWAGLVAAGVDVGISTETLSNRIGVGVLLAIASLGAAWLAVFLLRLLTAPARLNTAAQQKIGELTPKPRPTNLERFSDPLIDELREVERDTSESCDGGKEYQTHITGAYRVAFNGLMQRLDLECDRLGFEASRAAIKRACDDMADDSELIKAYFRLRFITETIEQECNRKGVVIAAPKPEELIVLKDAMRIAYEQTENEKIALFANKEKDPLWFYASLVKDKFPISGARPPSQVVRTISQEERKRARVSIDCAALLGWNSEVAFERLFIRASTLKRFIAFLKTYNNIIPGN